MFEEEYQQIGMRVKEGANPLHNYTRQRQFKLTAQRSIRARKGVATRLRNRIARGQCPCCSESFKNLKLHMKSKHPKWDIEKAVVALTLPEIQ